jgi:hypothetical protein
MSFAFHRAGPSVDSVTEPAGAALTGPVVLALPAAADPGAPGSAGLPVLFLYRTCRDTVAAALAGGCPPDQALAVWQAEAAALVAALRPRRRRVTLVAAPALEPGVSPAPTDARTDTPAVGTGAQISPEGPVAFPLALPLALAIAGAVTARGQSAPAVERIAVALASLQPQVPVDAVDLLIAAEALRRNPQARRLEAELAASAQPLPPDPASGLVGAAPLSGPAGGLGLGQAGLGQAGMGEGADLADLPDLAAAAFAARHAAIGAARVAADAARARADAEAEARIARQEARADAAEAATAAARAEAAAAAETARAEAAEAAGAIRTLRQEAEALRRDHAARTAEATARIADLTEALTGGQATAPMRQSRRSPRGLWRSKPKPPPGSPRRTAPQPPRLPPHWPRRRSTVPPGLRPSKRTALPGFPRRRRTGPPGSPRRKRRPHRPSPPAIPSPGSTPPPARRSAA